MAFRIAGLRCMGHSRPTWDIGSHRVRRETAFLERRLTPAGTRHLAAKHLTTA